MIKKTIILLGIVLGIFTLYFILAPASFVPAAYTPPESPEMAGEFATNEVLKSTEIIARGKILGPEDVDQFANGDIVAGLANGDIVRISADEEVRVITNTGGRPLGLHFDGNGNLIIADAKKGLLKMTPEGKLSVLASEADGVPFGFADDLDIAADGMIYFSDASWKWPVEKYRYDAIEAKPYGRLLSYNPATGETKMLLDQLYFANGIALSAKEDFVLVNESFRYRIRRYWLSGAKAGTTDIFIDNLPGFPDGVSSNRRGTFWVAMANPRNGLLDSVHPYPWVKGLMAKLPESMLPQPVRFGFVLGLDEQGRVTHNLQDPEGEHVYTITSVQQVGQHLLLGSLTGDRVGRFALPVANAEF